MKEPKDLKLKVKTKSQPVWEKTLFETETALEVAKVNQEIQEMVIELARKRIKEEKQKL